VASIVPEVERFLIGSTGHAEAFRCRAETAGDPLSALTAAELRVAECVAQGMTNPGASRPA
jgi:hypothetical protein